MAKPHVRERLKDILDAIDDAAEILGGADFGGYQRDVAKRRGTERCIEIVSEAARHIPVSMTDQHPHIPWAEVHAIGNKIRHDYQSLSDHVIWRTAAQSLPELRLVVAAMLGAIDPIKFKE